MRKDNNGHECQNHHNSRENRSSFKHLLSKWSGWSFINKKFIKLKHKEGNHHQQQQQEPSLMSTSLSLSLFSKDENAIPVQTISISSPEPNIISEFSSYIFDNNFTIERTVGIGSFSRVKLMKHHLKNGHELYAVKLIDLNLLQQTPSINNQLVREAEILQILQSNSHLNIIKFYNIMEFEHSLGLVMEFIEGGELFNYLVEKKRLSELETKALVSQVLDGINHLHHLGIVHRDIKLENILLDYRTRPSMVTIKLIDFGLAKYSGGNSSSSSNSNSNNNNNATSTSLSGEKERELMMLGTRCGSEEYAAPEILLGKSLYDGTMSDAWSVGVVTYACLFGSMPFGGGTTTSRSKYSGRSLAEQIIGGLYDIPNGWISIEATDFIKRLLTIDPLRRMTIKEAKLHSWLSNSNSNSKVLS